MKIFYNILFIVLPFLFINNFINAQDEITDMNPCSAYNSSYEGYEKYLEKGLDVPATLDYTNAALNPTGKVVVSLNVPDQNNPKRCGSCYAFATTGAIESYLVFNNIISTSPPPSLSTQQVLDCSYQFGLPFNTFNKGCNTGFEYIAAGAVIDKLTTGICSSTDYPYIAAYSGSCRIPCSAGQSYPISFTYKTYTDVSSSSLKELLYQYGPLTVGISYPKALYRGYKFGVFWGACSKDKLDHAVLLVGYGKDPVSGLPYWLLKNSEGPNWGENGYFLLVDEVGLDGRCGMYKDVMVLLPN